MNQDKPITLDSQAELMRKYIVFQRKTRVKKLLLYTGYFRLSRYGKYLLSFTNEMRLKPEQSLLFYVYDFDVELRKLFFYYSKKAEIQFKSHLSNAIALKTNDDIFYLNKEYYTDTKGDNDKNKRISNRKFFNGKLFKNIQNQERGLHKHPELKDYGVGGSRSKKKIPCWAAFSYFEFGIVTNIYSFLRGDLRKEVLRYGYSKPKYGKEVTKQMDTWIDAVRNLRNVCAHHNKLIGKTSSIVLPTYDDENILVSNTDLFSRIYALKKILNDTDGKALKKDLIKVVGKAKFDLYLFEILPRDWEIRYDRINKL